MTLSCTVLGPVVGRDRLHASLNYCPKACRCNVPRADPRIGVKFASFLEGEEGAVGGFMARRCLPQFGARVILQPYNTPTSFAASSPR